MEYNSPIVNINDTVSYKNNNFMIEPSWNINGVTLGIFYRNKWSLLSLLVTVIFNNSIQSRISW